MTATLISTISPHLATSPWTRTATFRRSISLVQGYWVANVQNWSATRLRIT